MQREGSFIQIALELNSRRINKALIVRIMRYRTLVKVRNRAQRAQIQVNNAILLWQQARCFRRGFFAQIDSDGKQQQDDHNNGNCDPRASAYPQRNSP